MSLGECAVCSVHCANGWTRNRKRQNEEENGQLPSVCLLKMDTFDSDASILFSHMVGRTTTVLLMLYSGFDSIRIDG